MSKLIQVNCPSCGATLRFQSSGSNSVGMNCPKCNHFFEVKVAQPKPTMSAEVVQAQSRPAQSHSAQSAKPLVAKAIRPAKNNAPQAAPLMAQSVEPIQASPEPSLREPDLNDLRLPAASISPVRPMPQARSKNVGGNSMALPTTIVGGFALVACIVVLLAMISTESGRAWLSGLNPFTTTPEGLAKERAYYLKKSIGILESLDDYESHQDAADDLDELEKQIAALAYSAAYLEPLDKKRRTALAEMLHSGNEDFERARTKTTWGQTRLNPGDPVIAAIQQIDDTSNAVAATLLFALRPAMEPRNAADQICFDGIQVEKKILKCLASVRTADGVALMLPDLQSLIDEFNALAEQQVETGERVSIMPPDYESIEVGVESARRWFAKHIQRSHNPAQEFEYTIQDLNYVEGRFDNALFKASLAYLDSTSQQRVESMLSQQTGETIVDSLSGNESETNSPPVSEPSDNLLAANEPGEQSERSSPLNVPYRSGLPDQYSYDENGRPQHEFDSQEPYDPFNEDVDDGNSSYDDYEMDDEPSSNFPSQDVPGVRPGSSPARPGFSGGRPPQSSNSGGSRSGMLSGPRSLTIIVLNPGNLDENNLRQRMSSSLNSRRSTSFTEDGEITLNFEFSGQLAEVAKHIDFGTVELSDSQSRTIYVDSANQN